MSQGHIGILRDSQWGHCVKKWSVSMEEQLANGAVFFTVLYSFGEGVEAFQDQDMVQGKVGKQAKPILPYVSGKWLS